MKGSEYSISRRGKFPSRWSDHQLLALLLEWAEMSPLESQEAARSLLEESDDIAGVLAPPWNYRVRYPQLPADAADLLGLYAAFTRRYLEGRVRSTDRLVTIPDLYRLLLPFYFNQPREMVYALFLDEERRYIGNYLAAEGVSDTVSIEEANIFRHAADHNAAGVVLAHNHPDGLPVFSHNDRASTMRVAEQLKTVDAVLLDHMLFVEAEMYSLRQLFPPVPGEVWPFGALPE